MIRAELTRLVLAVSAVSCLAVSTAAARATMTLSPAAAEVATGQSRDFTAVVTGPAHKRVRWSVCSGSGTSCVNGGTAASGTIVEIGRDASDNPIARYTAPAGVPVPPLCAAAGSGCRVTIKAKLRGSHLKSATASATIVPPPPSLTIGPLDANVPLGGTQQFSATVTGADPSALVWQADFGSITAAGLYTAPTILQDTDTVRASLPSAGLGPVSTTVHLTVPEPRLTSVTPAAAQAGDDVEVDGTAFYGDLTLRFPGPAGLVLDAPGRAASSAHFTVTVPHGAVSGPLFLTAHAPGRSPLESNTLTFTRIPGLRIRPDVRDLSQAESTQVRVRFLGLESPLPLVWSAQLGSVDPSGLYRAPASVVFDTFDVVTACLEGSDVCDRVRLGLHHFRIAPRPPLVKQSDILRLTALQGGDPVPADWLLDGGRGEGEMSSDGVYTAPATIESSGGVPVTATYHGRSEQTTIGVRGAFPGMIDRISDLIDFTRPTIQGTFMTGLAISGDRAYVPSAGASQGAPGSGRHWIDVYDLTNPLRPVWLDAVEAAGASANVFAYGHFLYQVEASDPSAGLPSPSTIAIFDVESGHPMLHDRRIVADLADDVSFHEGILYTRPRTSTALRSPLEVERWDLRDGDPKATRLDLALPYPDRDTLPGTVTGDGDRLFASFQQDLAGRGFVPMIATYDVAVSPPALLGFTEGLGQTLFAAPGLLFAGPDIYDVSESAPIHLSSVPEMAGIEDVQGHLALARTARTGLRVVDLTDPSAPLVTASLFDAAEPVRAARWTKGSLVLQAQGGGGLAIFDASGAGGLRRLARLSNHGDTSSIVHEEAVVEPYLYAASSMDAGGAVTIYDLRQRPAERVGSYVTSVEPIQALAVDPGGLVAFAAGSRSITALDVSIPDHPTTLGSLPLPAASVALSGRLLFVGTEDDRLVVLDAGNPAALQTIGETQLPGEARVLRVSGSRVLAAAGAAGLLIMDVSNPSAPTIASQFAPVSAVLDLALDGDLAMLACGGDGLLTLDVSDPQSPFILGQSLLSAAVPFSSDPPAAARSVAIHDGIVYLGTEGANGAVYGFDYRRPARPRLVALSASGDDREASVSSIAFFGTDVFIGGALSGSDGISQEDASQPRNVIRRETPPAELLPIPELFRSHRE